jgi:Uma2 family endonuclease
MSTKTRLMTADEFLLLPDDGLLHELVRGEVTTMSLPGGEHGEVAATILLLVGAFVKAHRLGKTYAAETGFLIERDPDTVRGADVSFVRRERLSQITNPQKHIPFAPDLVVEVLSPNDRSDEVQEKVQEWLSAGSQMVWVVDPRSRTITVHRAGSEPRVLTAEETIDGGDVIPGFSCRVADCLESAL